MPLPQKVRRSSFGAVVSQGLLSGKPLFHTHTQAAVSWCCRLRGAEFPYTCCDDPRCVRLSKPFSDSPTAFLPPPVACHPGAASSDGWNDHRVLCLLQEFNSSYLELPSALPKNFSDEFCSRVEERWSELEGKGDYPSRTGYRRKLLTLYGYADFNYTSNKGVLYRLLGHYLDLVATENADVRSKRAKVAPRPLEFGGAQLLVWVEALASP